MSSTVTFLQGIFGDKAGRAWVTSFPSFPESPGDWTGATAKQIGSARLEGDVNSFFCIGLLKDDADRRSISTVAENRLIVADDIGTKVDRRLWDTLVAIGFPAPTFKIETSPGNETWGWLLKGGPFAVDDEKVQRVRDWIAARELSDVATVRDAARYIRLPGGWNSKPKYKQDDGSWPRVTLIEMNPDQVADLDVMGRLLAGGENWMETELPAHTLSGKALAQAHKHGSLKRQADLTRPEPIIELAREAGLNPRQIRKGVVAAECPNAHNHSDNRPDGFAFLGNGLMHCVHDHCQALSSADFKSMICERYDRQIEGLKAAGLPTDYDSAGEFLANRAFDVAPVNAGDIEAEAERVARDHTERKEEIHDAYEAALDRLSDRFIYVQELDVFYDTTSLAMVPTGSFPRLECIREVIPVGDAGKKSAVNILLNRGRMMSVQTVTVKPGEPAGVVTCMTKTGRKASAVNLWSPSTLGARGGTPETWLALLGHILPDDAARSWMLDWMAYVLQNPGERPPTIPLWIGAQGAGKDLALMPFIECIGRHNVAHVTADQLDSDFNGYLRKRLIVLSELKFNSDKTYNKIKDLTGMHRSFVTVNEKFERTYDMEPISVFLSVTNHLDSLRGIEFDDRRWAPYVSPAEPKAAEWYANVADILEGQDELERVHGFLLGRDLAGFNPFAAAPDFAGMKGMVIAEGLSAGARWVYDACFNDGTFADRRLLTLKDVSEAYERAHNGRGRDLHTNAARDGLLAAGCRSIGRVRAGKDLHRLWSGPVLVKDPKERARVEELTAKEQAAMYQAEIEDAAAAAFEI